MLKQSLGAPRYSRDLTAENPHAVYNIYPVGGDFEGFNFVNKKESDLVNAGKMELKATASGRVKEANAAEERMRKGLINGKMPSPEDLQSTMKQFKIHLQPKKEFLPAVFQELAKAFANDEQLRELVPFFKASVSSELVRDENGQVVPEIVLYCPSYNAMRGVVAKLEEYLKDYEKKGSGDVPRYNWKINDLVYVAQSGADFKNSLLKRGLLDEYYDKNYNYAVRKGTRIFSRERITVIDGARNFVDLFSALDTLGGLMGSDQLYTVAELKTRINAVREGKEEIGVLTSSGGLRAKVKELLDAGV
ncbi:MAG: hypothetical protein HYT41_00010 [Candidatus Sungbacteria bacterium]|nr:hypothetical protein [Candidatus Sungbacteria bacterium]